MQAITTKYIGPSNFKGSRVKASCQAGSITLHWDDALNSEMNHLLAATTLASKLQWDGRWIGGAPHDTAGWVFVLDSGSPISTPEFTIPKTAAA